MNNFEKSISIGCPIMLILCVIFAASFIGLTIYQSSDELIIDEELFTIESGSAYDVADAFTFTVPFGRAQEIKDHIAPEKWTVVEDIEGRNEPLSKDCRFARADFGEEPFPNGISFSSDNHYSQWLVYQYDCPEFTFYYDLAVDLEKIDGKWIVVDWEGSLGGATNPIKQVRLAL